jgi:hypothetical protein
VDRARDYQAMVFDFALFAIAVFALSILLICGCFYTVSDSRRASRVSSLAGDKQSGPSS